MVTQLFASKFFITVAVNLSLSSTMKNLMQLSIVCVICLRSNSEIWTDLEETFQLKSLMILSTHREEAPRKGRILTP